MCLTDRILNQRSETPCEVNFVLTVHVSVNDLLNTSIRRDVKSFLSRHQFSEMSDVNNVTD